MLKVIRYMARYTKKYFRYLKYKDTIPKNSMHDDIYIVEFPKSGITWLSFILGNIEIQLQDKKEYISFYNHHKYVVDVHQTRNANINRFLNRTFIKSHSEFNPYYYFVVYLIRNPFDVMVSYYNFMLVHGYKGTFSSFVRDDNYGISKWKSHVNSWLYKKLDAQRMHFIKYEDLTTNAEPTITSLYRNFGIIIDKNIVKEALERSSINNMSASEDYYKKYNYNYTMSFVGKKNKIKKNELLTDNMKQYIYDEARNEIDMFYPDLIH